MVYYQIQIELPELMIEVRWIGEDGNGLKPSLKTGSERMLNMDQFLDMNLYEL